MKRNYMDEKALIFQDIKVHYLGIILKAVNINLVPWLHWQEKETEQTNQKTPNKTKQSKNKNETKKPQNQPTKKNSQKNRERKKSTMPTPLLITITISENCTLIYSLLTDSAKSRLQRHTFTIFIFFRSRKKENFSLTARGISEQRDLPLHLPSEARP